MSKEKALKRTKSRAGSEARGEVVVPVRRATAAQLKSLLTQRPMDVYSALGLEPQQANLSLPADGRGVRIKASVKQLDARVIPQRITLAHENRRVSVPVEIAGDYQEFRPLPLLHVPSPGRRSRKTKGGV